MYFYSLKILENYTYLYHSYIEGDVRCQRAFF